MAGTPITITFYNKDDSIRKEYSKLHIPLGLVDVALDIAEKMESEKTEETWRSLQAFLVEAFGNQFTLDELKSGADLGDVESVFTMIMAKIEKSMPQANPTPPGQIPRGRKSR